MSKGTLVGYFPYATHRSKKLYGSDANEFHPERWTQQNMKKRSTRGGDWSFMPCNGGPRECLGKEFAFEQAKCVTCRLVQHFRKLIPTEQEGMAINFKASGGGW